jgi:dihydroorotase-like cyclic amidohydrolase
MDLHKRRTVDPVEFRPKSGATPFEGERLV